MTGADGKSKPSPSANAPGNYDDYFLSYSGLSMPLKLVGQLELGEIENRNTFFGARVNSAGQTTDIQKVVYGEIEMAHRYDYHPNGTLKSAHITNVDGEEQLLEFDDQGNRV